MPSTRGSFLLATVDLLDPNFAQTVVLMVEHTEQGAMGLVMSRPTTATLAQAWQQAGQGACAHEAPLYQGGPVGGPLMLVHTDADHADATVVPGVYFTQNAADLTYLIEQHPGPLLAFVGYAGWAPGQLEAELHEDAWRTVPADAGLVFSPPHRLWLTLLERCDPDQVRSLRRVEGQALEQSEPDWN